MDLQIKCISVDLQVKISLLICRSNVLLLICRLKVFCGFAVFQVIADNVLKMSKARESILIFERLDLNMISLSPLAQPYLQQYQGRVQDLEKFDKAN